MWAVVATYSTFLQWVIKMDINPEADGMLDRIIRLPCNCPDVIKSQLRIVLEDELLWAAGGKYNYVLDVPSVNDYLDFLNEEKQSSATTSDARQLQLNRLFTLAWHNEWMEKAEEDLGKKAQHWIQLFHRRGLEWLT